MKFIELSIHGNGRKIAVNFETVETFLPASSTGTLITFAGHPEDNYNVVAESYNEIVELLK